MDDTCYLNLYSDVTNGTLSLCSEYVSPERLALPSLFLYYFLEIL